MRIARTLLSPAILSPPVSFPLAPAFLQALTPRPPPKRGDKPCPANCSGVGSCQHDLGLCFCPAGYGGPDCAQPRKRPCWRMGADKRDEGWHLHEEWSHSRCAGGGGCEG